MFFSKSCVVHSQLSAPGRRHWSGWFQRSCCRSIPTHWPPLPQECSSSSDDACCRPARKRCRTTQDKLWTASTNHTGITPAKHVALTLTSRSTGESATRSFGCSPSPTASQVTQKAQKVQLSEAVLSKLSPRRFLNPDQKSICSTNLQTLKPPHSRRFQQKLGHLENTRRRSDSRPCLSTHIHTPNGCGTTSTKPRPGQLVHRPPSGW